MVILSIRFCCHPHSTNCKHQQRHLELAITPFATAPLLCRLALDWQLISAIRLLCNGRCLPGAKPYAPALPTWTYWWYAAMANLSHVGHATITPPLLLSDPSRAEAVDLVLSYITSTLYLDPGIQNVRSGSHHVAEPGASSRLSTDG
jgi:hypothetical protein